MKLLLISIVCAFWVLSGGQPANAELHYSLGMQFGSDPEPEVYDMAGARGEPYGPAPGKMLHVFILLDDSAALVPGDSRELPVVVRKGTPRLLMFEDGRWQQLRPTTLTFGPEIGFGLELARAYPDESVGVVVGGQEATDIVGLTSWAISQVKCRPIALVHLGKKGAGATFSQNVVRTRLGNQELVALNIDMTTMHWQGKTRTERQLDFGRQLGKRVVYELNKNTKDE